MTKPSEFLSAFFAPDTLIHFRAFKAKGDVDEPGNRPVKFSSTINDLSRTRAAELRELNKTRGVYFAVNEGGDSDEDITRFTSFFVEKDDLSLDAQHRALDESSIKPSIRIETRQS